MNRLEQLEARRNESVLSRLGGGVGAEQDDLDAYLEAGTVRSTGQSPTAV